MLPTAQRSPAAPAAPVHCAKPHDYREAPERALPLWSSFFKEKVELPARGPQRAGNDASSVLQLLF
jgi:hypothetical protein